MYLKKLELVGFKSFLSKTVLHFEPGITAIVGPNGCGKSNIFDSIRWVLGEQSVKALRGSDMQDVIFNGTDFKEPLSMAEVTLTFDNSGRFFNTDYDEVAITRRIFRSGESEYLLNKNQVRLKDILDLLMGTGIGAESYSLVAQGKIDLVLSSRPEDRRLVFDEAAGITKYKSQKRETMRRLEETEQNLLRVNDIITEVKRQIGSLERQANKARRYKEVFEELKSKEIKHSLIQLNRLVGEKDKTIADLTELQAEEIKLLEKIREGESKISSRQEELKSLEQEMMSLKEKVMNLNNEIVRNDGHANFNSERIKELESNKEILKNQIEQAGMKLRLDEEKISKVKQEYEGISSSISEKKDSLKGNEARLSEVAASLKSSLEAIARAKKGILELVAKISQVKNEISDAASRKQIQIARHKRLELEKAKINEEKTGVEININEILQEINSVKALVTELSLRLAQVKGECEHETRDLNNINAEIDSLEKERLTLESHREFLLKLKSKYEDISESMNAVVYLDKMPDEGVTGLVIKVKSQEASSLKLNGEAKPFELDTYKIDERIQSITARIEVLNNDRSSKQSRIEEFNKGIAGIQEELRNHEITLANKEMSHETVLEQYNKIKDEFAVVELEIAEVGTEMLSFDKKLAELNEYLAALEGEHKTHEDSIVNEQNKMTANTTLKEEVLVAITQVKTELDALSNRISQDEATLKMLEDSYQQDMDSLINLERQLKESDDKKISLEAEIKELGSKNILISQDIERYADALKEKEALYRVVSETSSNVLEAIETDRSALDGLKNKLYELQVAAKDIDFRFQGIRDRIYQAYRIELDSVGPLEEVVDEGVLSGEIEILKDKLDSYGTVNLVAIEEYDELKKRYDFLTQQQNDLVTAKDALVEAIHKINRTTRKLFLETFEKVKIEFRNYFRLLFNGGDAQIFLTDEEDPLESGIEMICRPPGKKLQNVLLLSGGEKSMSAIALILAIFKVKPSPFCALDEIDAALDEANVDRYSRAIRDFASQSQFIIITHNKKTIANADVMYGITMEESGVSKIVSVKFGKDAYKDKVPENAVAEPV